MSTEPLTPTLPIDAEPMGRPASGEIREDPVVASASDLARLQESQGAPAPDKQAVASRRLRSLDAFRGLTILSMLLVNNVALDTATPRQLRHAEWNAGVHFADLVFPWFLLIVGVALPWSIASARRQGASRWTQTTRVLGRAAALFGLGCLLDSSIAHRPVVGLGVLQLIGLAYCAASVFAGLPGPWRGCLAFGALALHAAAIRFIPVPGVGAGVFEEERNLIRFVNEIYLQPWGLKGLVSVIPTMALVLIGTLAGDALRSEKGAPAGRGVRTLLGGLLLAGLGWAWSQDLPFNKPVWTGSYILFAGGTGLVLLAIMYLLIDVLGTRLWNYPLVVFGSNAILAYVAPILIKIHVLQEWRWPGTGGSDRTLQQALLQSAIAQFGPVEGGALYTAGYILCWWLVLAWFYHRRIFLRV